MHDCKSNARESRNVGKPGKFYTKYTIVQLALSHLLSSLYKTMLVITSLK